MKILTYKDGTISEKVFKTKTDKQLLALGITQLEIDNFRSLILPKKEVKKTVIEPKKTEKKDDAK